ncbi:unnamed protein product [Ceratitis capitata]|uniref:(Mediterranean fruit fly) hypothetical protein n=1 Tax=Ceratitis capitata TaxID=7213 RepID=A0A811V7L3_CERCA|nr:unnamed protein product [Ceratitis capitata]
MHGACCWCCGTYSWLVARVHPTTGKRGSTQCRLTFGGTQSVASYVPTNETIYLPDVGQSHTPLSSSCVTTFVLSYNHRTAHIYICMCVYRVHGDLTRQCILFRRRTGRF